MRAARSKALAPNWPTFAPPQWPNFTPPLTHLVLPAQFTETKTFVLSPYLPPKVTAPNELLDPVRLDEDVLRNARSNLGDAGFMAQYQQAPFYQDTQYRVVENLREIAPEEFEAKRSKAAVYHSWDTAYATHSNADYTALIKWAVVDGMAVIIDVQRFRRPTDEVQKAILLQMHADRPAGIYVESAPHSDAMIAIMNRMEGIPVRITAVKSGGLSKEARLEKVLHHVNLGKVGMLRGAPGLPLLLQELREFPTGRHDDLVDSFSMALDRMPFSPPQPYWRIS
jgi:predicted phage terminase large subunit-like protein